MLAERTTAPGCAGLVTAWVSLAPAFQDVQYRAFRAGLFATLGLWGIVPALHGWLLFGDATPVHRAFIHDVTMGAVYLVRAATTVTMREDPCVPVVEICFPGSSSTGQYFPKCSS